MNKYQELEDYYTDFLIENGEEWARQHEDDLHYHAFNTDYYIIGTYKAKQWLGENVFECIETIKEYEQDNFGEVTTDLSDPEKIVNMYAYIVGEQVVYDTDIETIIFND